MWALAGTACQQAHPRVGGENVCESEATGQGEGSSPRGRGKRALVGRIDWDARLIPAWAGKTEG